ncbi:MAG: hypothetical protein QXV22_02020 [Thermoplasmataceae archaeon]
MQPELIDKITKTVEIVFFVSVFVAILGYLMSVGITMIFTHTATGSPAVPIVGAVVFAIGLAGLLISLVKIYGILFR